MYLLVTFPVYRKQLSILAITSASGHIFVYQYFGQVSDVTSYVIDSKCAATRQSYRSAVVSVYSGYEMFISTDVCLLPLQVDTASLTFTEINSTVSTQLGHTTRLTLHRNPKVCITAVIHTVDLQMAKLQKWHAKLLEKESVIGRLH